MRIVYILYIIIIFFLSGCAAVKSPQKMEDFHLDNPLLYGFNEVIDFKSIQPGDIDKATTSALKDADKILTEVLAVSYTMKTYNNTLFKIDNLYHTVSKVWNLVELLSSTHPAEDIRREADENDLRIQTFMIDLSINEDLYKAIRAYSNSKEAQVLTGGKKRFLNSELNDFKRSGMELNATKRLKLKEIQTRLSELSIKFSNNIISSDDTLYIHAEMTGGLPEDYKRERLQLDERYAIDLSYPSFDPFMKYADSDSLRKLLRYKFLNIAYPENLEILNEIVSLCKKMSEILGYRSYAAYTIEESMAKTPTAVWKFENSLRQSIETKASMDTKEMLEMKRKHTGNSEASLYDWDKYYYENMLLLNKYSVDSEKVKEYFELGRVIEGFFIITGSLFGLQYHEVENPSVWHEDITMYEVFDEKSGRLLGRFYLDLYPRAHKYQHAAEFTIISGKRVGDSYQIPVASLVCNFPKSSEYYPSLLPHEDVETLFHEFGHLIHDMLSKTELMSQSGTSVPMDFVEAPSQMLENWVWNKESLDLFAKHYKTGEGIPDTLVDHMLAARNLQSGNDLLQQVFYGMLDLTLYDGYDPDGLLTTTDIIIQLQNSVTHYPYFEGTHQQASFDHLLDYSASYYGYLWSEVYAHDMFSVFEEGGLLNPAIGSRYREEVLEKGGSEDPITLVINFLGRQPNNQAFLKSLGIEKTTEEEL